MLRMAVGHAQCLDADCAARGAVDACRRGLGGRDPLGLLVSAGVDFDHELILRVIEEAFAGVPLIGATTAGALSGAGVDDDSLLVVAFGGSGVSCATGIVPEIGAVDPHRAARDALAPALDALAGPPALCLVLADGSQGGIEPLALALAGVLGPDCPVAGGLASRHVSDTRPIRLLHGREIVPRGAVFLVLGGAVPVLSRVSRGWRPVGGRAKVTSADPDGVVRRIGDGVALDFYRHYLGPHAEPAVELPLAVTCQHSGDFILRSPGFFSEDDGSIRFPAGIPEGATVQLAEANRSEMLAGVRELAAGLAEEARAAFTPAGALLFSCSTRKEILGSKAAEEARRLAKALPAGTPVAGFYCHGEIASAGPGLPLHLQNGTLLALVLGGHPPVEPLDARLVEPPCPAGETETLRREIRSLTRALARAVDARERLEAQKERSQALMRAINQEINEARLEIQRKNALLRQALALAEEVQRNLLPQQAPRLPGCDIAGTSLYSDETGGDYFDFITAPDDGNRSFGIVIGDVSGHGVAAALLMTTVRAFLRMRCFQPGPLAEVVGDVNRLLCADVSDTGRFMTLSHLVLDPATRRLTWVRAGHDPIILCDTATGLVADIPDQGGPPLGIIDATHYAENHLDLAPGQILLLATDGLWEARNAAGIMYGKDRVRESLRRHAARPAGEIVAALLDELQAFLAGESPGDDVTLVVIRLLEADRSE